MVLFFSDVSFTLPLPLPRILATALLILSSISSAKLDAPFFMASSSLFPCSKTDNNGFSSALLDLTSLELPLNKFMNAFTKKPLYTYIIFIIKI